MTTISTQVCIVGGGPAGMMLGYLLARSGINVAVLEKHDDFLRDFRGDTVHPSTLNMLDELGVLDAFLQRPHNEARSLVGKVGDTEVTIADFGHVPGRCKFIALMPQWDFLDFLSGEAKAYPGFHLHMQTEASELIYGGAKVVGVKAQTPKGELEVRAELVVACDGRRSILRQAAGLIVRDLGSPMDVLWMRLPKEPGDFNQTGGRINFGSIFVTLDRGDYWQCAYVIKKGGYAPIEAAGIEALRARIARIAPDFGAKMDTITSFDQVKLLTVTVDRLEQWSKPGLLCIGDAAHAMSPIGGVGINLAVQDAVAAANILVPALNENRLSQRDLVEVQRRRIWPTRATQAAQVFMQDRVISRIQSSDAPLQAPAAIKLFNRWPLLRRIPARLVGVGVRPEHIRTHPVA